MEINKMSEKELKQTAKEIQKQLDAIQKKKEERERRKKEYALVQPEPKYKTDYARLWQLMLNAVEKGGCINSENIDTFFKAAQDEIPIPKAERYPCPECGEVGSLYVGEYGDYDPIWGTGTSKRRITCSNCDFVCPARYEQTDYDAWETFHGWLVRNGYLDAPTKDSKNSL